MISIAYRKHFYGKIIIFSFLNEKEKYLCPYSKKYSTLYLIERIICVKNVCFFNGHIICKNMRIFLMFLSLSQFKTNFCFTRHFIRLFNRNMRTSPEPSTHEPIMIECKFRVLYKLYYPRSIWSLGNILRIKFIRDWFRTSGICVIFITPICV